MPVAEKPNYSANYFFFAAALGFAAVVFAFAAGAALRWTTAVFALAEAGAT